MIKKLKFILILLALLIAGGAAWWLLRPKGDSGEKIEIEPGRVADLRAIAELCATEFYREASVLDTVKNKVIFGIQKQRGSITFCLDSLPAEIAVTSVRDSLPQDTLRLRLPKEKIEVLEATDKDSWRVIDTKSTTLFGSSVMTPDEENVAKRRAVEKTRRHLYADGTVKRSRDEAAATLSSLLSTISGRPVKVTP